MRLRSMTAMEQCLSNEDGDNTNVAPQTDTNNNKDVPEGHRRVDVYAVLMHRALTVSILYPIYCIEAYTAISLHIRTGRG